MIFERKLKIGVIVFGFIHLFATYATLFVALASGMARFDGGPTSISLFLEKTLIVIGMVLLAPFGYLPIPFIGPVLNSALWALGVYYLIYFIIKRRTPSVQTSSLPRP